MLYRDDVINRIVENTDFTKRDAGVIIDTFTQAVTELMSEHESVMFKGFGCFEVKKRQPKAVVPPGQTEKIVVDSFYAPHFTPSKTMKRVVREGRLDAHED